jgi:two-component system, cell cycle response regulator DivK
MPKILLVEDNEENWEMLSRRLTRRGYVVVIACDGQQAVDMALSEAPDLILMDMNMPVIDGWEATRRIRAMPETHSVPIIAVTAHSMADDRDKILAAGCGEHHVKPVDLTRLLAQIEAMLNVKPVG